jgi:hypothetical protein
MHHRSAEPTLEEALSEDIIRAVMKADHVDPMWLRELLESVARKQRSCSRFQGDTLGAWSPRRRHSAFG